ncbi:MAG: DNA polymerase III subunit delta [Elusimicrobia bacterium]|nr:DNA polymerase III subunit delta [Elusimicrobiota bacterium]
MELTPAQAEKEWKAGKFRPVYYFVGENSSAKDISLQKLKDILRPDPFNLDELSGDSPQAAEGAVAAALTPPLMSERRLVVVKNPRLGVEGKKTLAQYLRSPLETTTLILCSEERRLDIRDVLAAAAAALGGVVLCKPLRAPEAAERLIEEARKRQKNLSPEAARMMVEEAGTEWRLLGAELEKLILYARNRQSISPEDALACLGYRQNANPFDFPRALQSRNFREMMALLRRLLEDGEEPFRLLHQITGSLNKLLKAKRLQASGSSQEQIFRELRLQAYYDRDFPQWVQRWRERELLSHLTDCLALEAALKSQPWLDAGIELERLAVRLLGNPGLKTAGGARAPS